MHTRFLLLPAFLLLAPLAAIPARAAFTNGVETFNGSTLDTATWQKYAYYPENVTISQNNALNVICADTANPAYGDYTTLSQTVAVGQRASVDVTVNSYNPGRSPKVYFALTNNSLGNTGNTYRDTYRMIVFNDKDWNVLDWEYGPWGAGAGGNFDQGTMAPQPAGTTYHYEIQRLSASSATFLVTDALHTVLGSSTVDLTGSSYNSVSLYPGPLYLSLGVEDANVTFDNVTISALPEPASLTLLALAATPLLLRRKPRP